MPRSFASSLLLPAMLLSLLCSCETVQVQVQGPGGDSLVAPVVFTDPTGALDTTFGTAGIYRYPGAGAGSVLAIQSDGKMIVAGKSGANFFLRRLDKSGQLDTTFGVAGLTTITDTVYLTGLVVDGLDRILVSLTDAVYRFTAQGVADSSFGVAGKFTPISYRVMGIQVNAAHEVMMAGHSGFTLKYEKLNASGVSVLATNPLPTSTVQIYGTTLGKNGSLYVNGIIDDLGWKGFVGRITAQGLADTTYGTASAGVKKGWVSFSVAGEAYPDAKKTILLDDGSILVSGVLDTSQDLFLAKLTPAGALDTGFGTNGTVKAGYDGGNRSTFSWWYQGWSLAKLANGKFVVIGNSQNNFAIAKYDSDGVIDSHFGTSGVYLVDVTGVDMGQNIIVTPDGTIYATGGVNFLADDTPSTELVVVKIK